ncbi:peptidase S41 [Candidatus Dependentiae bacterium Noda2021]|nr:peptidase S41 [Candidatus Dependentiae bacterium Noda2021]
MKIPTISMRRFILTFFSLGIFVLHADTAPVKDAPFDEMVYNWTRSYAEVLQLVNQKHYKVANAEQCFIKSINEFANNIDPHSNFLDPKTYKAMLESTSGEFFGIGIVIDNSRGTKDKFLLVVEVIPDGPADKAGIKQYDKIIEINGLSLEGMSTDEATSKLKGPRNTKVTVKVLREGQQDLLTFDITRDVIKEPNSLSFHIPNYDMYYLSLSMFSDSSARQLENLLRKSQEKKYKGLILDLRNNSGGLLTSVVDIAGLFLQKGSLVVTTKNKEGKETERYVTKRNPVAPKDIPIFILINNFTASAAEILAGCLKIHAESSEQKNNQLVFVVGTNSFGKGSVQEVIPLSNNCALKLTTSLYFLPQDISIQGTGIVPDFVIERRTPPNEQQVWFTKNYGSEQALTNYIKINPEPTKDTTPQTPLKEKSWVERTKAILEQDNQLRETITLINILDMLKTLNPSALSTRKHAIEKLQSIFVTGTIPLVEVKQ